MWPSSSTRLPAGSLAGECRAPLTPALSWMPWSRHSTTAGQPKAAASSTNSGRGSQYVAIKYTERLTEAGVAPSVGSVGDSYGASANAEGDIMPWLRRSTASTRPRCPTPRALAQLGRRRVRHPGMGGLVQPPAPAGAHRQHSARRGRSTLLCSNRGRRQGGVTQPNRPPGIPALFTLIVSIAYPLCKSCKSYNLNSLYAISKLKTIVAFWSDVRGRRSLRPCSMCEEAHFGTL
jgi:hypothetical protein